MKSLLIFLLLMAGVTFAQKKYLVSPHGDFFLVNSRQSASEILKKKYARPMQQSAACTNQATFGYPEELFSWSVLHAARHKDVMGMWFIAQASGTIDTLFWDIPTDQPNATIGALDSTVYVRVHESNIGPDLGPGVRPGPYNPPCQNWGYWTNTNDLDQKVAAFPEDATDTTWHSTYNGPVNSFPPFGNGLWGGSLGVSRKEHLGVNYQAMLEYDTLRVSLGQKFFISMRVKGPIGHPSPLDEYTTWATWSGRVSDVGDENYPSRNWKFYEHDSGPANCAGVPVNLVKRGWVARGGFGDNSDSLDVAALNWWFTMTVTSNVPPVVSDVTELHNTFATSSQLIEATITDCDVSVGGHPGVASALIKWSINNVPQPDITALNSGGDIYEATIPGEPPGSNITYKFFAQDSSGASAFGPQLSYRVVGFGSSSYYPDTGAACAIHDISSTGTTISNGSFFLPPTATAGGNPTDDGCAGPYALGGDMTVFGDDYRYAWIGVNGALTLSKNATDTLDVNANGFYTAGWTFPYANPLRTARDTSTAVMGRMPINFIAPFWNDLILADTSGGQFGHIRYQQLSGADSCIFVAEWDSLGAFITGSSGDPDESRFRAVLNRCDGTIEFQYENIGLVGLDSTALVGMQGQTNSEYVFLNQATYPIETKPRNNWCIKFYPATTIVAIDSWNMVSVGVNAVGGNYAKATMFPTAQGPMFAYTGAYTATDPLSNGPGYWAKFSGGGQLVGGHGTLLSSLNIPVSNSWNMVGGIGHPVATSSIGVTGGSVASSYFGYGLSGYSVASTITPGYGYWVKMNGSGSLSLNYPAAVPKQAPSTDLSTLNKISIVDASGRQQTLYIGEGTAVREPLSFYELPPSAPGFDARYTSGRMVETYPASLDKGGEYEYPITISQAAYPVSVRWSVVKPAGRNLVLSSTDGKLGNTVMNGSGSVRITDANVKTVVVRLADVQTPKTYALSQNYPNPFNPTTHFDVSIPKTAYVTVAIYDVLGRQVKSLMSGQQGAGYYTMEWDGRDARGLSAPTGIYFIRMLSDEFKQTQKIMLMK